MTGYDVAAQARSKCSGLSSSRPPSMSRNNDTICCSEKLGYEGPGVAVQDREFFSGHSNLDFVDLASMEGERQVVRRYERAHRRHFAGSCRICSFRHPPRSRHLLLRFAASAVSSAKADAGARSGRAQADCGAASRTEYHAASRCFLGQGALANPNRCDASVWKGYPYRRLPSIGGLHEPLQRGLFANLPIPLLHAISRRWSLNLNLTAFLVFRININLQ